MRLEVGAVSNASRIAFAISATACGLSLLGLGLNHGQDVSAWEKPARFAAFYMLALLSFAAFPRSRRTDLTKLLVLAAAMAELIRGLAAHDLDVVNVLVDAAGAYAVLIPTFLERLRALIRSDRHEPFSMVYPGDRRRRRSKTVRKSSSPSGAAPAR